MSIFHKLLIICATFAIIGAVLLDFNVVFSGWTFITLSVAAFMCGPLIEP